MKLVHTAGSALVILLAAVSTMARAGASRTEVLDALAEARRTGELMAPGDSGLTLREMNPDRYPAAAAGPARTRADVVAEVREALRDGDLAMGDSGMTGRDLNPGAYPARPAAAGRSRGEVRAELAEALRTGDIMASGDSGQTLRERDPARYAMTAPMSQRAVTGVPRHAAAPC